MTASWTWWLCFRADGFQSAQGSVEHSVFSTRSLTVDVVIQTAILSYVLVFVDYRTPVPLHQTLWSIRFVSRDSKLCDVSDVGLATPNLTSGPGAEWIFMWESGLKAMGGGRGELDVNLSCWLKMCGEIPGRWLARCVYNCRPSNKFIMDICSDCLYLNHNLYCQCYFLYHT